MGLATGPISMPSRHCGTTMVQLQQDGALLTRRHLEMPASLRHGARQRRRQHQHRNILTAAQASPSGSAQDSAGQRTSTCVLHLRPRLLDLPRCFSATCHRSSTQPCAQPNLQPRHSLLPIGLTTSRSLGPRKNAPVPEPVACVKSESGPR